MRRVERIRRKAEKQANINQKENTEMTDIIENQLGEQEPGEVREKTGLALDPATLSGDIAESLVGWYKCQPKPWNAMSYDDQKGMIDAIESLAERIVCKAVSLIAKNGRTTIQIGRAHV